MLIEDLEPMHRRELLARMVALVVGGAVLNACGSDEPASGSASAPQGTSSIATATATVYVGPLDDAEGLIAVAIDDPSSAASAIRAYVCDGSPPDRGGFALWFKGTVAEAAGGVASSIGGETLQFTLAGDEVSGTVTFGDGSTSAFGADLKTDGSGIYDVTVGADGSYDGVSLAGTSFDATITNFDPHTVKGTLTDINGSTSAFSLFDFEDRGFDVTVEPGAFTAVALRVDDFLIMAGRSGDVRGGSPGLNIIGCWDSPA